MIYVTWGCLVRPCILLKNSDLGETIIPILSLAYQKSRSLVSESGYVTKDTVEIVLTKAESSAFILMQLAQSKGYGV